MNPWVSDGNAPSTNDGAPDPPGSKPPLGELMIVKLVTFAPDNAETRIVVVPLRAGVAPEVKTRLSAVLLPTPKMRVEPPAPIPPVTTEPPASVSVEPVLPVKVVVCVVTPFERFNVPLEPMKTPEVLPKAEALPNCNVPAFTVVDPV